MVDNTLQEKLEKKVISVVDEIIDSCYPESEVFDELCDKIDTWTEILGYKAYIRVFWHNDGDDLYEVLDDVMDITNRFNILAYCNLDRVEYNATFTVMLYKEIRDE